MVENTDKLDSLNSTLANTQRDISKPKEGRTQNGKLATCITNKTPCVTKYKFLHNRSSKWIIIFSGLSIRVYAPNRINCIEHLFQQKHLL